MDGMSNIESGFFNSGGLHMQYGKWGNGPHVLIAFHGFGRSHLDFIRFTRPFLSHFTVYGVDIFFHGESNIGQRSPDKTPLTKASFASFMEDFINQIGAQKVWLMGFSLGGRLALTAAELLPSRIGGLYLFAPDGLVVNRWYALLSHSEIGRKLFRFFMRHNTFFLHFLNALSATRILSRRTKVFVLTQVKTPEMQQRVYNVWSFLRKLEPDYKVLGGALEDFTISVDVFFGHYDNIIPPKNAHKLKKYYPPTRLHTLRAGHIMLTASNGEIIFRDRLMQLPELSWDGQD